MAKVPPALTKYLSEIGTKGGKAVSEAKREASRKNAAKARETRLAKDALAKGKPRTERKGKP